MFFIYLLEGFTIGFLIAMPTGPIGVLCVRRTLTYGNYHGLIVGLGSASADVVYALIAAFGITLVSDFIIGMLHWIRLAGGVLLLILGILIFRSYPSEKTKPKRSNETTKSYISIFLLALTNPMTLFAYVAVFSGIRSGYIVSHQNFIPMLVLGIFLGSISWFSLLTNLTCIFKKNITNGGFTIVNRTAGCLLMSFGVISIWISTNRL